MLRRVAFVLPLLAPALARAEPASSPETPKPAITIGGYVEMFYQINFGSPSNRITNLRGFDNRERTFTLSNVAIDAKGERGPLTAHVILQVGSTPSTYYLSEPTHPGTSSVNVSTTELWKYVQQATLAYTTSDKLVVDAGVFPSPVGPEVIPIKDNWNWSRSNLFFALPFYHTGIRVAVPLGGGWTGMVHAYNGWNSVVDNNAYPSVGVSAAYAGATVTGQVLYFGGIERPAGAPEGKPWRNLFDAYATIVVSDEVSLLVHGDAGVESNDIGRSGWVAGALYGKVQLSPKLYAAARGDYFREWVARDGGVTAAAIFWPTEWISSLTATLACQPTDGLSVRLELRHRSRQDGHLLRRRRGRERCHDAVSAEPRRAGHRYARRDGLVLNTTARASTCCASNARPDLIRPAGS